MVTNGNTKFKMFSLFSGSGGFELASTLCGIEPVGCSEIEPFPIRVTRARFPNMKHYGDISKIDVNELETVDLITGGSPCQDMSVAGKRSGMSKQCPKCDFKVVGNEEIKECPKCGAELEYTRSGLFMEQIRIVKEMRKKDELEQLRSGRTDEHIRPRFMLWENVTGAFSSNKGEDFRAVLEETAKIKDPTATIPRPPKGKWQNSGLIVGDGYSIAWRVFDAQYWGVPQRRRRIALVADFGGQSAGEILFKRNGLSRNFTESRKAWQGIAGNLAESIGETGEPCVTFEPGAASRVGNHTYENQCGTLRANMGDNQFAVAIEKEPFCYNGENLTSPLNKQNPQPGDPCHTLGTDPRNYVMEPQYSVDFGRTADRIQMNADKSVTLLGEGGGAGAKTGLYCLPVKEPQKDIYCMATQQGGAEIMNDKAPTITAAAGMSGNNQPVINQPIPIQDQAISNGSGNGLGVGKEDDPMYTLMADTQHGIAYSLQGNMIGREDHNGPQGSGVNEDVAFTLNATDRHAVAYGVPTEKNGIINLNKHDVQSKAIIDPDGIAPSLYAGECRGGGGECYIMDRHAVAYDCRNLTPNDNVSATIQAKSNGGQSLNYINPIFVEECKTYQQATGPLMANSHPGSYSGQDAYTDMFVANEYIVRRLTPLECSRLQGFPDWWCDGLQNETPTVEDLIFWSEVFETHREIVTGASKPKTDKQIMKWLQEEPNDGAMYKMWGNGIALPCFLYVIEGIKEVLERTSISNPSITASEESKIS